MTVAWSWLAQCFDFQVKLLAGERLPQALASQAAAVGKRLRICVRVSGQGNVDVFYRV